MLAKLSYFLSDILAADVNITALMEIGLVIKQQRKWFGTSPYAI